MILPHSLFRRRLRLMLLAGLTLAAALCMLPAQHEQPSHPFDARAIEEQYPLVWKHIHSFDGTGGAWYIPAAWIPPTQPAPKTILEAALLASNAALSVPERKLAYSNIPLLMHQTGRSSKANTWNPEVIPWVEQWLEYAVSPPPRDTAAGMAYFFWDDEGIDLFMDEYERDLMSDFNSVFTPVERADVFRVLACRHLGGVYADIDTQPLRPPATWIGPADLTPWTDDALAHNLNPSHHAPNATTTTTTTTTTTATHPVNLIWGIEADTDPSSDTYWRMGYTYPIQLTQWALASSPGHPALGQFMHNLRAQVRLEKEMAMGDDDDDDDEAGNYRADPLTRTGPAAVTLATMQWLGKEVQGFRWNSLTGLKDGGRSKLVQDVLILPITGFSPGRGTYGNMGSKPITHPDARLVHHALGSWKKFDWVVEYGKFCRTAFGLCRDWTKVVS
ncbi:glycosyltransferase family 32 protein [Trichoderma gracile]